MKFKAPDNHRLRHLKIFAIMVVGYVASYPLFQYIVEIKRTVPTKSENSTFYLLGGIVIFSFLLFSNYCLSIEINADKKYIELLRTNILNRMKVLKIDFSELEYKIMETDRWKKIIFYKNGKKAGQFWSNEFPKGVYESVKNGLKEIKKERKY